MDRRSWPWKKKSSEKMTTATYSTSTSSSNPAGNQEDQERMRSVTYVQVSLEKYVHLTGLEDQVTILNEKLSSAQSEIVHLTGLEDQVTILNEKLSSAQSEITTMKNLIEQHAKVAEEAVSGWEKAEADASALKIQLESVTLLKLTAEERASHLDGALNECMKQIRNVKEESEQKLHDVVFAKTKQWEKVKAELEAKIVDFEQELLRASAENTALSRSLQERSAMLMKISDEKSQADADIEVFKNNIESFEREINSLKYELHVVSKELEIRNEEKNMSMRSADVANKQHLEDVKKISKLEADCQRLRGLIRKKLPGPAALAQMKLEVENLGRDSGETKLRCSPSKNSSPHHISTPVPDFSLEQIQQFKKENEFLTTRLLAMEEETKMLKEALSKRNSELQASRNMCANTTSKLRSLEAQMFAPNQQKSPFSGTLSQHESNPPSLTSMSEDGVDEEASCSGSWATALVSELSQFKKEKDVDKSNKAENSDHLKLMDDFLEMGKLACLLEETNGTVTISDGVIDKLKIENAEATSVADIQKNGGGEEQQLALVPPTNVVYTSKEQQGGEHVARKFDSTLSKLQSRIVSMFESGAHDTDMEKLFEGIRHIIQEVQEELSQHSGSVIEENHSTDATCDQNRCHEDMGETTYSGIYSKQDHNSCSDANHVIYPGLKNAISQIHDFILSFGKEAMEIQGKTSGDHGLSERIDQFSASVNKVLCNEISINDFILALSHILCKTSGMSFNMSGKKGNEGESKSSDCIDKVTLLENEVVRHASTKENFSGVCSLVSYSSSDPEIEGPMSHDFEVKATLKKCSLEEYQCPKLEKENMEMELTRCNEMLECTKHRLVEMEENLAELKSQLAANQKSKSLSETQLKCMVESYKTLESWTQELEAEVVLLHTKAETLENELQEERRSHQDDLAKCKDLQEQIERNGKSSMCSGADNDIKFKQDEIAAAAEKLAECQETILLLGRQLQAMRPPAESLSSYPNNRYLMSNYFLENEPGPSGFNPGHSEMENASVHMTQRTGGESPFNGFNSHMSPSDTEASSFPGSPISLKRPKHRLSRSSSSTSLPDVVPEKHRCGISRFLAKGKSDH